MAETITLKGAFAGFAFNLTFSELPEERVAITGTAGTSPVDLIAEVREDSISLSGWALGKECLVNGSKNFD